jgi:hypothetical protein
MKGLGALFGIIAAIGGPVLKPGSLIYTVLTIQDAVGKLLTRLLHLFTFGVFNKKDE